MDQLNLKTGDAAKVRNSIHSPYSGNTGIIRNVNHSDNRGAYLVSFSDGLQFRYQAREIEPLGAAHHTGIIETVVETLSRVLNETRPGRWWGTHTH